MHFFRLVGLISAFFAFSLLFHPPGANAQSATAVRPVMVDRENGFVMFVVKNNWSETIGSLFGKVYAYAKAGGGVAAVVNNPNAGAIKISLGEHRPGTYALYRFKVPEDALYYPDYRLYIENLSLRHTMPQRP